MRLKERVLDLGACLARHFQLIGSRQPGNATANNRNAHPRPHTTLKQFLRGRVGFGAKTSDLRKNSPANSESL